MRSTAFALALLTLLAGCQTLKEVSVGYADAIAASELPPGDAPLRQVEVRFPSLTDIDPLSSPSLSRYAVTREELESVKATEAELEPQSGCALPFSSVELQVHAAELGAQTFAKATIGADGCPSWTIDPVELAPWFRQPSISIVALVDGEPYDPSAMTLQVRAAFLIDVADKRIEQ